MDAIEKKLKYEIVRNCEVDMYTPLWEVISIIDDFYPNLNEASKIEIGKKVIVDLVHKGFIELYLGSAFSEEEYTLIREQNIKKILDLKDYWFSSLAPKKYIELYLTPLSINIAIGKLEFEKIQW